MRVYLFNPDKISVFKMPQFTSLLYFDVSCHLLGCSTQTASMPVFFDLCYFISLFNTKLPVANVFFNLMDVSS